MVFQNEAEEIRRLFTYTYKQKRPLFGNYSTQTLPHLGVRAATNQHKSIVLFEFGFPRKASILLITKSDASIHLHS